MRNSCPLRAGGSPSGRSVGKTSLNSRRTSFTDSGILRVWRWDSKSDFTPASTTLHSSESSTFLTNPKNALSVPFFNKRLICLALTMLTSSISSFRRASGRDTQSRPFFTTTVSWVQLICGLAFLNQGMPRIMGLRKPGNTLACTISLYPPDLIVTWTLPVVST